jgi:hypothetical protein
MQAAIRKQRNVNAIIDTGAQVTTMPESAVNRMPAAHNHRDAPPGTAVKYGNGEIETIERLVDNGHYEVQITPDNCSTSLISVDQIVADGHTVTFSATEIIITDNHRPPRAGRRHSRRVCYLAMRAAAACTNSSRANGDESSICTSG